MPDLKSTLEAHFLGFPYQDRLSRDPVGFVYRYSDPGDREVAALFSAVLAYGNVAQILATLERLFAFMGDSPRRYITTFSKSDAGDLRRFRHRFTTGRDIAALCLLLRRVLEEVETLESLFVAGNDPNAATIEQGLCRFVASLLRRVPPDVYRRRSLPESAGVRFLLSSPELGSACKRMNLFLRWMVRPGPVDLRQWRRVEPRQLVLPVDTHIARIGRYIGMTQRRTIDWKMALQMTDTLRTLDPKDPVRYDFALCHLGIMRGCPARHHPVKCMACPLEPICTL